MDMAGVANQYIAAHKAAHGVEKAVKMVDGGFQICDAERSDLYTFVTADQLQQATRRLLAFDAPITNGVAKISMKG